MFTWPAVRARASASASMAKEDMALLRLRASSAWVLHAVFLGAAGAEGRPGAACVRGRNRPDLLGLATAYVVGMEL